MSKTAFFLLAMVLASCAPANEKDEVIQSGVNEAPSTTEIVIEPILQISDLHTYEDYGTLYVGGSVTNISDKTLKYLNPSMYTYTEDDVYIEKLYGMMEFDTLLPDQTATFEISLYSPNPLTKYGVMDFQWDFSKPAKYSGEGKIEIALPIQP